MPGAFAHITAVNFAMANSKLAGLDMPKKAKLMLTKHQKFVELGCVSPDYPYLKIDDSNQNSWADKMHYEKVGIFIKKAIILVKQLSSQDQEKAFSWLCGFVAHVIADITIHPVVELKVGPYNKNKSQHRICEMNQDAYIWQKLNLGDIGYADRIRMNIGTCVELNCHDSLDRVIHNLWEACLKETHPDHVNLISPDIDKWHQGFLKVVDHVEEGHKLFPFARHVAAELGLTYPDVKHIDVSYIDSLKTPCGIEHYDSIFERAVSNIQKYWCYLAKAIYEHGETDMFLNWNLDTGHCESHILTAWV
ncbi:zinc dependent phospholipase C family protein [Aeromonas veronii]